MDDFKKQQLAQTGWGGLHCPCCNEFHGKERALLNRTARAKLKEVDQELIDEETLPYWYFDHDTDPVGSNNDLLDWIYYLEQLENETDRQNSILANAKKFYDEGK